jgi:hypothetical protein
MSNWGLLAGFTSSTGNVNHADGRWMTAVATAAEVDDPAAARIFWRGLGVAVTIWSAFPKLFSRPARGTISKHTKRLPRRVSTASTPEPISRGCEEFQNVCDARNQSASAMAFVCNLCLAVLTGSKLAFWQAKECVSSVGEH